MEKNECNLSELLSLFEETLDAADILTSKIMAQISTAITKERLKSHMNQSEFAKYINASQSLVSRWERGDYNFSIRKIAEIATALNLDVDFSLYKPNVQHYKSGIEYKEKIVDFQKYSSSKSNYTYISKSYTAKSSITELSQENKKSEGNYYASIC